MPSFRITKAEFIRRYGIRVWNDAVQRMNRGNPDAEVIEMMHLGAVAAQEMARQPQSLPMVLYDILSLRVPQYMIHWVFLTFYMTLARYHRTLYRFAVDHFASSFPNMPSFLDLVRPKYNLDMPELPPPRKIPRIAPGAQLAIAPPPEEEAGVQNENYPGPMNLYNPVNTAYIDVGTIRLEKHGRQGNKIKKIDCEKLTEMHVEGYHTIGHSAHGKVQFRGLSDMAVSVTRAISGSDYSHTATFDNIPIGFNDVGMLELAKTKVTDTFTEPLYANAGRKEIANQGSGNALAAIFGQVVDIHMKNVTKNQVAAAAAGPPATPEIDSFSQCHVELLVVQAKENIAYTPSDGVNYPNATDMLDHLISEGFNDFYATESPAVTDTTEFPPYFTWNKSTFFEKFKIIDRKEWCMYPGQEIKVSYALTSPQILSYKYKLDAEVYDQDSGPVWNYAPVVFKKGEMQFIIKTKGGLAPFASGITFEKPQVVIYMHKRFVAGQVTTNAGLLDYTATNLGDPGALVDHVDVQAHGDD